MVIQSMFPAYIPANTDMIGGDIRTTILLDGKPFTANIDTGQEVSSLNTVAARAVYGITPRVTRVDARCIASRRGG